MLNRWVNGAWNGSDCEEDYWNNWMKLKPSHCPLTFLCANLKLLSLTTFCRERCNVSFSFRTTSCLLTKETCCIYWTCQIQIGGKQSAEATLDWYPATMVSFRAHFFRSICARNLCWSVSLFFFFFPFWNNVSCTFGPGWDSKLFWNVLLHWNTKFLQWKKTWSQLTTHFTKPRNGATSIFWESV